MKYQLASNNVPFGVIYDTLEEALLSLSDAIYEGKKFDEEHAIDGFNIGSSDFSIVEKHFNTGNQNAKKAVTANKFIHVRVTEQFKYSIKSAAAKHGLKESEFVLYALRLAMGD